MLPASSLAALRPLPRRQTHVRPRDVAQRATWRGLCILSRRPGALASTAAHSLRLGRNAVEPDFPNGCDEEFCLRCLRISMREHVVVEWENRKNDLANCSRAQETTETKPLFMGSTDEAHPWRAVSPLSPSVSARAGMGRLSEEDFDCATRDQPREWASTLRSSPGCSVQPALVPEYTRGAAMKHAPRRVDSAA